MIRQSALALLYFVFWLSTSTYFEAQAAFDPDRSLQEKVAVGLEQFTAGNFAEAAKLFAEAGQQQPSNSIVKFDEACALAASGDENGARESFMQSALSNDPRVAAASYYNLAALAAAQARKALGDDPLEASNEQRTLALERLQAAETHYRNCLKTDSTYEDARHNLELLRLYVDQLQKQWKSRDRQRVLAELELPQLLEHLEKQQLSLRSHIQQFKQRSVRTSRFERSKIAEDQKTLADDIQAVVERIGNQFEAQPQSANLPNATIGAPAGANASEQAALDQLKKALRHVIERARQSMVSASEDIVSANWDRALKQQREAVDRLRETYALLSPLTDVLQRSIAMENDLLQLKDDPTHEPSGKSGTSTPDQNAKEKLQLDRTPAGLAWQQEWIGTFSQAIGGKAQSMLKSLPDDSNETLTANESALTEDKLPEAKRDSDNQPLLEGKQTDENHLGEKSSKEQLDQQAQLKQLRIALSKAVELTPMIGEHSANASKLLSKDDRQGAKPDQQEVLRLLREIAELLPKEAPQDQQNKNQNSNQNQDQQQQQNQQQQDRNSSDQSQQSKSGENQSSDQEKQKPSSEEQTPSEQSPSEQSKDNPSPTDPNSKDSQKPNQANDTSENKTPEPNNGEQQKPEENQSSKQERQENPDKDSKDSQAGNREVDDQDKKEEEPIQGAQDKKDEKEQKDSKESLAESQKSSEATEKEPLDKLAKQAAENPKKDQQEGTSEKLDEKQLAQLRAQAILRRIREREAKYRELMQQLRELQGKRSPVEKDW